MAAEEAEYRHHHFHRYHPLRHHRRKEWPKLRETEYEHSCTHSRYPGLAAGRSLDGLRNRMPSIGRGFHNSEFGLMFRGGMTVRFEVALAAEPRSANDLRKTNRVCVTGLRCAANQRGISKWLRPADRSPPFPGLDSAESDTGPSIARTRYRPSAWPPGLPACHGPTPSVAVVIRR